jgi:hypothetical protein
MLWEIHVSNIKQTNKYLQLQGLVLNLLLRLSTLQY